MSLADLIATARRDRGWSQTRLASESGVERTMIQRIEAGLLRGSPETMLALARTLDLDPGAVLVAAVPDEAA